MFWIPLAGGHLAVGATRRFRGSTCLCTLGPTCGMEAMPVWRRRTPLNPRDRFLLPRPLCPFVAGHMEQGVCQPGLPGRGEGQTSARRMGRQQSH